MFSFLFQSYIPSKQDILFARKATKGIVEHDFVIKKIPFKMVDVGGQRSQRQKWFQCFDGITSILFMASSSEYDQVRAHKKNTFMKCWCSGNVCQTSLLTIGIAKCTRNIRETHNICGKHKALFVVRWGNFIVPTVVARVQVSGHMMTTEPLIGTQIRPEKNK